MKNKIQKRIVLFLMIICMIMPATFGITNVLAYTNGSDVYNSDRYDYRTRRYVNVNFNGGTGTLSYAMNVDRDSKNGITKGMWLADRGIGKLVRDIEGHYHYLRAWSGCQTPSTRFWMEVDSLGATPYLVFSNLKRTGYTYNGITVSLSNGKKYYGQSKLYNGNVAMGIGAKASGWTKSMSSGSTALSNWLKNNPDINFVVNWKANTYTVVYNGNGATGGSTASSTHTYDTAKNLTANGFYRNGYDFAGWATSSTGAKAYDNQQSVKNLTATNGGTVTLYAVWTPKQYTVNYNANGGTGNMSADKATYNQNYTPKTNSYTRDGYEFIGWNEKADGSGTSWTAGSAKKYTYTNGMTLYAQWKETARTNKIAHWAGGFRNSEGNNSAKNMYNFANTSFNAKVGENITLEGKNTSIPNGFYAESYFGTSSISGSWETYSKSRSVKQGNSAMSFEFYYQPETYNIEYVLNGGENASSNPKTYNVLYGVTFDDPVKKGHKFDGWYINGTKVTGINQGANANFSSSNDMISQLASRTTGNVTVEARFTPIEYTVVYYGNGSTGGTMSPSTHTYGVSSNLSSNAYVRNGYDFVKWNTKSDGTGSSYGDGQEILNLLDSSGTVSLYAQWSDGTVLKTFSISYDANGGEGTMSDTSFVDSQAQYIAENLFTRTGHKFIEWNTKPDGTGLVYQEYDIFEYNSSDTEDASMTLYAQWQKNELTVYYDANTGFINDEHKEEYSLLDEIIHFVEEQTAGLFSFLKGLF